MGEGEDGGEGQEGEDGDGGVSKYLCFKLESLFSCVCAVLGRIGGSALILLRLVMSLS